GGLARPGGAAAADPIDRPSPRPLRHRPARRIGDRVKPWCAVLLAAGEGTRLRPLTELRPKPLCPVGNVPLLERALEVAARLGRSGPAPVAVNASWLGEQIQEDVDVRAHISWERDGPLGTAGDRKSGG